MLIADHPPLIHINFKRAEDTLAYRVTYLLARLCIGILCTTVIETASGHVSAKDGIRAELVSAR